MSLYSFYFYAEYLPLYINSFYLKGQENKKTNKNQSHPQKHHVIFLSSWNSWSTNSFCKTKKVTKNVSSHL